MRVDLSVIITTKNSEFHLKNLLESLRKQRYRSFEIIVVDNHSHDQTREIAKQYTKKVYIHGVERSSQRNFGAKKAKGGYLVFLDADMMVSDGVLSEIVAVFKKDPRVKAIIIPEESIGIGFWSACKIYERQSYLGVSWIEMPRAFRKDVFWELEGYDESLTGPEDFDLPQRLVFQYGEKSIARINAVIIHNEGRMRLLSHLRKKFYYGLSMNNFRKKTENKNNFMKQSSLFQRFLLFVKNPRLSFRVAHIFIGTIVLKTLEMIALALGYFVGRYRNN